MGRDIGQPTETPASASVRVQRPISLRRYQLWHLCAESGDILGTGLEAGQNQR